MLSDLVIVRKKGASFGVLGSASDNVGSVGCKMSRNADYSGG